MPSNSKVDFEKNVLDIENIWTIHGKAAGKGKGRKHKVEVLNRAVVVFIYACWEAYVEDVLREAVQHLVSASGASGSLAQHLGMPLEHALENFHTANARKTGDLFEGALGLPDLPKAWKWQNQTPHQARTKLDELVRLRGRIAHRVSASTPIGKAQGTRYLKHVTKLVDATDNAVAVHVAAALGSRPWPP